MMTKEDQLCDFIDSVENCGIPFSYVENEGQDVRFDLATGHSFWIRPTNDGGCDIEGVSHRIVAKLLTSLGARCLKASEGCYHWSPKTEATS